jgi:hypothetical protein
MRHWHQAGHEQDYVFTIFVWVSDNHQFFKWYNTTNGGTSQDIYSSFATNEWYTATIEWSRIPNKFQVKISNSTSVVINATITNSQYDPLDAIGFEIGQSLSNGDNFGRCYIDYINIETPIATIDMNTWIPIVISFAMLGMVIGVMKKMAR